MSKEKKRPIYVAYLPVGKEPRQSLTHYACSGGKRGYMTLRRRDSDPVAKPKEGNKG